MKRIIVDGTTIPIRRRRLLPSRGGYPTYGEYKDGVIYLAPGQTRREEAATVLHEILHHIWERSDLRHLLPRTAEEAVISRLEVWLLDLFTTNPELSAYLFGPLED